MLSTAKAGAGMSAGARPRPTTSAMLVRVDCRVFMMRFSLCGSGLDDWREGVGVAVLGEHTSAREREMRAADHHLVGDDAVDQLAARSDRLRTVLIVDPFPFRVWRQESRHVHGVIRYHQLIGARGNQEDRVTGGMADRREDSDAGSDF